MRKLSEILSMPANKLTDEEFCKVGHHRFQSRMTMFVYVGDDKKVNVFFRFTGKFGRAYWSRVSTPIMKLWDKVSVQFDKRFNNEMNSMDPIV